MSLQMINSRIKIAKKLNNLFFIDNRIFKGSFGLGNFLNTSKKNFILNNNYNLSKKFSSPKNKHISKVQVRNINNCPQSALVKINKFHIYTNNNSLNYDSLSGGKEEIEGEDLIKDYNNPQNNLQPNNNGNELFNINEMDSILEEVNNFFITNRNNTQDKKQSSVSSNLINNISIKDFVNKPKIDLNTNKLKQTYSNEEKIGQDEKDKADDLDISSLLNEEEVPLECDFDQLNYEDSIFGYKSDSISLSNQNIEKFPFIKKLLFIYKFLMHAYIQKMDYRSFCQRIFKSEEFNLENMDEFQNKQPLEIRIAYYISFKSLRGSAPMFLNKNIKNEIFEKFKTRDLSLIDILVYSKLNIVMQDINLMYKICDFLNPIFSKSISVNKYFELVEYNPENIDFFVNLHIILLPCQKFLNLIIDRFENLYMNIFTTIYNLRTYNLYKRDVNPLRGLLYILNNSYKNKIITQSDTFKKFEILINNVLIDYTDNYCSKLLESSQFSNLVNYFTIYYSSQEKVDDLMIKKILDINFLCINVLEKYSEEVLIILFKSIDIFLIFFDKVKDKILDKEELSSLLKSIIFSYFTIYKPTIAISNSSDLDFTKIKNLDIIYLIKLKYMLTIYFPRTNPEASSYIIAINNLIDNSLNNITEFTVIYAIMGKCGRYLSIHDKNKFFEFYVKNIKTYINDANFFLFVHNYDLLEKYGDIADAIDGYRSFIIRQLIKMFYIDQVYYIFAKPDKLFYTILALCNNTHMIDYDISLSKKIKKSKNSIAKEAKEIKESQNNYKKFEDIYYPVLPKEIYRFLNIIYYKIKTDPGIFNIYASRIETILSIIKLSYLFQPNLIEENYFSVLYPSINFYCMNFIEEKKLVDDINFLNLITYYISLVPHNEEIMLCQLKLLAKIVVIGKKITESPQKLFFSLKKIEETYLLNPDPYYSLEKNPRNPKFLKLILRIKSTVSREVCSFL